MMVFDPRNRDPRAAEFRETAERAMRVAARIEEGPARTRLVALAAHLHQRAVSVEAGVG